MADQRKCATDVWWHGALAEFAVAARERLRAAYPSIRHAHEDLAGDAVLNVAQHLNRSPAGLPPSWFVAGEPPVGDVERFQQLAFTVLNRRIADHFRLHYRHWLESLEGASPAFEAASQAADAGTALDLRRAATALLAAVEKLPDPDRLFMREVAMGGSDAAMSANDRQRLHRLRANLLATLRETLKRDPMDVIRKL